MKKNNVNNDDLEDNEILIYSFNNEKADESILLKEYLSTKSNWVFREYNKDLIYDWVIKFPNTKINNTIINNFFDITISSICNKYQFHKYLNNFDFIPKTYLVNSKYDKILENCSEIFENGPVLLKSHKLEFSKGIKLVKNKSDLVKNIKPNNLYVIQHLIKNPKLYNNKAIDIRYYVILVYCNNGINVYLFKNGINKICEYEYDINNENSIIVNRNQDNNYLLTDPDITDIVVSIVKKSFTYLIENNKMKKNNHLKGYHLFGLDFIQDINNKVWFLESNHGPLLNDSRLFIVTKEVIKSVVNISESLLLHKPIIDNNLIKIY